MLRGEWWIDEEGQTTFADGDMGESNHISVAFEAALGISLEDSDIPEMIPLEPLSKEAIEFLKERDTDPEAIEYLKDGSDPRDYALEHMGWIRVAGDNFQMWSFDDDALDRIQNSEVWDGADVEYPTDLEESDEKVLIEQYQDNKTWSIPVKVLLNAKSSEGVKRYMEGIGKWRNPEASSYTPKMKR